MFKEYLKEIAWIKAEREREERKLFQEVFKRKALPRKKKTLNKNKWKK